MTLDDLIAYYIEHKIPFTADLVREIDGENVRAIAYNLVEGSYPYVVID